MRVRFDGLTEPTHLAGVWRAPGEVAEMPEGIAREFAARGVAVILKRVTATGRPAPKASDGSPAPKRQRLFLNGCEVARFPERTDAVVSVIVPMYRSARFLPALLRSLRSCDAASCEWVFVSDGDGRPDLPGKLVVLPENRGFAAAVNAGAAHAAGRLLCLLNADVEVRQNWLTPMVRLIDSAPDVGAVGNRNLDRHGCVDSIGSEFSYKSGQFEHLLLASADVPGPERDGVAERDMITAACLLVRRDAWARLGGMDEGYRIAYFEDSDFCLRLREAGYRILYCPQSTITHYKNHSGAGWHEFYRQNKSRFHHRWVRSGLVDKFARQRGRKIHDGDITACYIVLNEEEFIQASLESIYPLADRIVIVEGGNDYAVSAGLCGPDKRSTDATVERIESFPDPGGKIEVIRGAWRDKTEQRNAYASLLAPGDWMLLMDGDEVFFAHGLWRLSALMHEHEVIQPGFALFWNDFLTVGAGVWDEFPQIKMVKWRAGYHYGDHNCPCDGDGRPVVGSVSKRFVTREKLYAHYAWVKPIEKLRRKTAYYERQPGARERMRPDYIDTVFLPWRERPLETVRRFGTHPFGGGGAVVFEGEHPEPIRKRLAAGQFAWQRV